jgi:Transposase, Mutator family
VSRICAGLDEIVAAFGTRTLGHVEFPYVYLDATYLNVRNATGQVVSMAVIVATGIAAEAPGRSSAWMSATARTRRSGAASSPASSSVAWAGSGW